MANTVRSIFLVIAGIVSIGLSIHCFNMNEGEYCSDSMYGGDAYTGMQNASASAARNVKTLSKIVKSGFGSTLLVCGLTLIAFSIQGKKEEKDNVSTFAESTIVNKNETAAVEEQEEVPINNEQPQNEETKA